LPREVPRALACNWIPSSVGPCLGFWRIEPPLFLAVSASLRRPRRRPSEPQVLSDADHAEGEGRGRRCRSYGSSARTAEARGRELLGNVNESPGLAQRHSAFEGSQKVEIWVAARKERRWRYVDLNSNGIRRQSIGDAQRSGDICGDVASCKGVHRNVSTQKTGQRSATEGTKSHAKERSRSNRSNSSGFGFAETGNAGPSGISASALNRNRYARLNAHRWISVEELRQYLRDLENSLDSAHGVL
jgi:hypothetical protein